MAAVVCNTRALVTIVVYRKWRVRARSRSTDTAAKREKETPAVVQVDKALSLFSVQNEAKLSLSSAIFSATKGGWHISPTKRSEVARQPNRIKDGLWRSCVFPIVNALRKFPVHVTRENKQLRIHVRMFATKIFSVSSKLLFLSGKYKQVLFVLFMLKKTPVFYKNGMKLTRTFFWSRLRF